jgi:dihydrofolate reductase
MLGSRGPMTARVEGGALMADLIYSAITSLDGYIADRQGNFDWAAPDEEVHSSSTTSSEPSARTCMGGGCTR